MIMPRRCPRRRALDHRQCIASWPMEEMPHGDVAGCCLAAPANLCAWEKISVSSPVVETTACAVCLGLDWAGLICDGKGRCLPTWLRQTQIASRSFGCLPNPPHNSRTPWSTQTSQSLTSSQPICRPAAILSLSQAGAERNAAASVGGWEHALANSDDESDDDLPSLEELLRTRPQIPAGKASRTERTSQHLDPSPPNGSGTQAGRIKSGKRECQGDSLEKPMILDDESDDDGESDKDDDGSDNSSTEDKAEDCDNDIEIGNPERDASPQAALETSDLASGPTRLIDISGPWYDVDEGRYIDDPNPTFILSPVPKSLPDHDNKQYVSSITVEQAPRFLHPLVDGNHRQTDDRIAEFGEQVERVLIEESNSSPTSAPTSPRQPVHAPQDKFNPREHTETTSSRPEEPQGASRYVTGLQQWEQQEAQDVALHTRSSRCLQPPSTTNFEADGTLLQADHESPTTLVDNERYCGIRVAQSPSVAIDECSDTREDEDGSNESIDKTILRMKIIHDTGDEEEDPRPAKRRKMSSPLHNRVSTHGLTSVSISNEQLHVPRPSLSPTTATSSELAAEYREWSFQGILKSVRIGTKTIINIEFTLDDVPELLELSAPFEASGRRLSLKSPAKNPGSQNTTLPARNQYGASRSPKKWNPWTEDEDATLKKMKEDKCSWEDIAVALPLHTQASIQVRHSTKSGKLGHGGAELRKRSGHGLSSEVESSP